MTNALDRQMIPNTKSPGWVLPGLGADRPVPSLERKLDLFGQFVGDWDILPPRVRWKGGEPESTGKVHFRWILGGTAVQDIWGALDDETGQLVPQGSTLRFYDPSIRAWQSTWISPYQRVTRRFIGRKEGAEIVLREQDAGSRGEHWIFWEVNGSSFRWRAETPTSSRAKPRVTQEYYIRRAR